MPRTEVSIRAGRSPEQKSLILTEIYEAMRETIDVPEDDVFATLTEHDAASFVYGRSFLGIARSDDLIMIRVTLSEGRRPAAKRALFRRIAERLSQALGLRPEDVFIVLVETRWENWSFGEGAAQYAT